MSFFQGPLLRQITDEMKLLRGEETRSKLEGRIASFYAAHEHNVAALSKTLGIKQGGFPAYGSTVILETYSKGIDKYYVRVSSTLF